MNDLKLDETNNVVYTKNGNLYFKTYKYDSNSELYVVTDIENSEDIIKNISNMSYKMFSINDKASLKKYKTEYLSFAKENNFEKVKIH